MKKNTALFISVITIALFATSCSVEGMYASYQNNLRSAAGLVEKTVQIEDYSVSYLEGGKGPTILFVHGFGAEKDYWTMISKELKNDYHLIALDLPGFGHSDKRADRSYDVESQADRIHLFLNTLNTGKVFIIGNSMGGNIAGIFAAKYPEEVNALGLINTAGIIAPEKSDLTKSLEMGINPLLISSPADFDRQIAFGFYKAPIVPAPVKKLLAENAMKNKPNDEKVWVDMEKRPILLQDHLNELTMPVLVIWGDKDRIINVSCVGVLEKGLKNYTTHILKDCGHAPMMERPEETATYIKDFTRTHDRITKL